MYWRVRKISPEMLARQYGVHAVCIVSVFFNLIGLTRMTASKAVTQEQKTDFDHFARTVSQHLFDASYLTFDESMISLCQSELGPSLVSRLKHNGDLPQDSTYMRAQARDLREKQSVSCVKIYSCAVGQQDQTGLVPVDVELGVVKHTTEGVDGPVYFKVTYKMGLRRDTQKPIVAALESKSLQGPPVAGQVQQQ